MHIILYWKPHRIFTDFSRTQEYCGESFLENNSLLAGIDLYDWKHRTFPHILHLHEVLDCKEGL